MKIDPYYQRQKCRPMNLVSENIRFMRIFAGVPLGGGDKRHWRLLTTAIFGDLAGWLRNVCNDMLPLVDQQTIAKWMTLSGYFMTENAPQKMSRRERQRESWPRAYWFIAITYLTCRDLIRCHSSRLSGFSECVLKQAAIQFFCSSRSVI